MLGLVKQIRTETISLQRWLSENQTAFSPIQKSSYGFINVDKPAGYKQQTRYFIGKRQHEQKRRHNVEHRTLAVVVKSIFLKYIHIFTHCFSAVIYARFSIHRPGPAAARPSNTANR